MDLITEVVRDPERFAAIANAWDALAVLQGSPLARHAWYSAALAVQLQEDRLQEDRQLWTVLVWHGEQLEAAAPLLLDSSGASTRLVPIDAFTGEPDRLLFRSPAALAALARACAAQRRPLLLRRLAIRADDRTAFSAALRSRTAVLCRSNHASATVLIPACFEELEAKMSSNRRSAIRRKWRNAGREFGEVSTEFLRPKPADLAQLLSRIEAIEGAGWKGQVGTSLGTDRMMGNFITLIATAFAKQGLLLLAYLRFGDADAACRLILQQGSGWFEIKIGYDEQFSPHSPGVLLMHETLREASRTGISRYHFLGLHESWQDHWPNKVNDDHWLSTYPLTYSGGAALVSDGFKALGSSAFRLRR